MGLTPFAFFHLLSNLAYDVSSLLVFSTPFFVVPIWRRRWPDASSRVWVDAVLGRPRPILWAGLAVICIGVFHEGAAVARMVLEVAYQSSHPFWQRVLAGKAEWPWEAYLPRMLGHYYHAFAIAFMLLLAGRFVWLDRRGETAPMARVPRRLGGATCGSFALVLLMRISLFGGGAVSPQHFGPPLNLLWDYACVSPLPA